MGLVGRDRAEPHAGPRPRSTKAPRFELVSAFRRRGLRISARDFFTIVLDLGGIIDHANMLHRGANKRGACNETQEKLSIASTGKIAAWCNARGR
jgi:hypothetical protein